MVIFHSNVSHYRRVYADLRCLQPDLFKLGVFQPSMTTSRPWLLSLWLSLQGAAGSNASHYPYEDENSPEIWVGVALPFFPLCG